MASLPLRVVTFNIRLDRQEDDPADNWSGERRDAVVDFLRWVGADIFGLQEVQPKQLAFLADALAPEYAYVGIGRERGGVGEASPIFFRADRFKLALHETRWLSHTPYEAGSKYPGAGCTRLVTCAELVCSGSRLFCFCTHLDHVGMTGEHPIQKGQAEILCRLVDSFCGASHSPRIVLGDFNSISAAGAPPVLLANDYSDCSDGDETATFVEFDDRKAGTGASNHIDWIFARGLDHGGYTLYDAKYEHSAGWTRNVSDHIAVGVQLSLAARTAEAGQTAAALRSLPAASCRCSVLLKPGGRQGPRSAATAGGQDADTRMLVDSSADVAK